MMGNDVERIVAGIEAVRKAASNAILSFAEETAYQIISKDQHAGLGTGPCRPPEKEKPAGFDPMTAISTAMGAMGSDSSKMESLGSSNYTSPETYNNGLGSPWTELANLKKAVEDGSTFAGAHSPFDFVGEKAAMLSILNMIVSAAVDAKWAMITYHDYIQRGYDNVYNGNKPSITFNSNLGQKSVGNVSQQYSENVNIPKQSIDPF